MLKFVLFYIIMLYQIVMVDIFDICFVVQVYGDIQFFMYYFEYFGDVGFVYCVEVVNECVFDIGVVSVYGDGFEDVLV